MKKYRRVAFGIWRSQTQIHRWIKQVKESVAGIFFDEIKTEEVKKEKELHKLHAKIGQLTVERDFFSQSLGEAIRVFRRQSMV